MCEEARIDGASSSIQSAASGVWDGIWKLKVPGRIKHVLWKACTNSLPTKVNLMKQKILNDSICQLCGRFQEDTKHALWDCEAVKRVWCKEFSWINPLEAAHGTFLDLVDRLMSRPSVTELFATTAWFIWTHRNKVRLREKTILLGSIDEAASSFLQKFKSCREEPKQAKQLRHRKWQPPESDVYKLNFDGVMFNESNEAGIGIVVRDSSGVVLAAMAEKIWKPHNVESLEMLAARRAIIFA